MEFRLLGEIEVCADGREVDIGHTKQRYVLAALAVDAGRSVPADTLVERVWGTGAPRGAKDTMRAYLCRLRQALDTPIVRRAAGYMLAADPLTVDVHRFRHLVTTARTESAYASALDLWRGEPLGRLDTDWSTQVRASLARERKEAEHAHVDLLLADGRHGEMIGTLIARAEADPFDERLAGQLMLALHRGDRRADALSHYARLRRRLADELGIDPSSTLQRLFRRIVEGDAAVPRQLPPRPAAFTGRAEALAALDSVLLPGRVAIVHGPGGVGKTWLASCWAHHHAHRYPDGQLYVNLRGFDPSPVPAGAAIRGLLYGLGVSPAALPPDPDSQVMLYRSLLAERRVLLVLDDARTADQVEPLLPGAAGCATLITSRSGLVGLVVRHGARPVPLGTFSPGESALVLTSHLGPVKVAAEPRAVASLVRDCAGLPLALGVVAGRAALAPALPLAALAADLSAARLDGLDGLRAVLAASVAGVRPAAAELFARLGHAPGPDIGPAALGLLTGPDCGALMLSLRELIDVHLVEEHRMGRYRMHDLVRLYAAELGGDPGPVRSRLIDHYVRAAQAAGHSWFEDEHEVLLSCVELGDPRQVVALAGEMSGYLNRSGRWHDRVTVQEAAIRAAMRLGDRGAEAGARRGLAAAQICLRAYGPAAEQLAIARRLFMSACDRAGLAAAHRTTAALHARQHRHADALVHDEQSLLLYVSLGHVAGQATVLNAIGWHHAHLGRPEVAVDRCSAALALHERLDDELGRGLTRDTLGFAYHLRGDHAAAITHFEQALTAFRNCGDRFQEAETLHRLGASLIGSGAPAEGREAWRRAAAILTGLGHPAAADVLQDLGRTRLAGVSG